MAHAAAYELDLTLYRLHAEQIPTQTAELDLLIRLWRREAALLPLALLVEAGDIDRAHPRRTADAADGARQPA
ncbi:hypothetical protein LP419_31000 [Massilia sp. H-1]|nr:hypothetical protein LP419_31000 [Massilia sp. H-1]